MKFFRLWIAYMLGLFQDDLGVLLGSEWAGMGICVFLYLLIVIWAVFDNS